MEQSEKSMLEKIEELQEALKIAEESKERGSKGSALNVQEHMGDNNKYLSLDAKNALSKYLKNHVEHYNEQISSKMENGTEFIECLRKVAVAQYFCCRVRKDKVEEGVKAISEVINELAEMGAIYSCLAPVSSLDLAILPYQHPICAVFCFVHIKPEFMEQAQKMKHRVLEGGIGESLHDIDIELPPGEFFAECHLTHRLVATHPVKSNEARVLDIVGEFLKFLPVGTEFVEYRPTTIIGLSVPYELKFRNPLLQRVKRVELDYVREIAIMRNSEKESIKEFDLLIGVRYLGIKKYGSNEGKIEDLYAYRRVQD